MEQGLSQVEATTNTLQQLDVVRDLIATIPAVGEVASYEGFVQAMFDPETQAVLTSQIQEVRVDHWTAIDEFFASRCLPEAGELETESAVLRRPDPSWALMPLSCQGLSHRRARCRRHSVV